MSLLSFNKQIICAQIPIGMKQLSLLICSISISVSALLGQTEVAPLTASSALSGGDECIKIGLVDAGDTFSVTERFDLSDITNYTVLSDDSDSTDFAQFDIIYLAPEWADFTYGGYEDVEAQAESYLAYVANGGNLLLEQPNPNGQPNDSITPTFLPYPITFYKGYDVIDFQSPSLIIDPLHPLTFGINANAIPNPIDSITNIDPNYHVLAIGSNSGYPSLLTANYGEGRVLITGGPTQAVYPPPVEDVFLFHLLDWFGSAHSTETHASCDEFLWSNGVLYSESNQTDFQVVTDGNGCNEYVSLNLTIAEELEVLVTSEANELTTVLENANYQWVDCNNDNAPITGETNQVFIPDTDGNYAVEISQNNCIYSSECVPMTYYSITEHNELSGFEVYPNPTENRLNIQFDNHVKGIDLRLINQLGKEVKYLSDFNGDQLNWDMSELASGIYVLQVGHKQSLQIKKIIKR